MEIIIDKVDFWNLKPMRYWSHPKSYDEKKKKLEAKSYATNGQYIGSRKMDGFWQMIIKDTHGHFYCRGRSENTDGGYTNKIDWIPQIKEELSHIPCGTVLLGEIYFPNNEGSKKVTSTFNCLKEKCLEKQKKEPLHFYIFDVIAYNNKSLIDIAFNERINHYLYYELLDVLRGDYLEIADYKEGMELWQLYKEVLAAGGEGIVITQKTCKYLCGKRQARTTLKLKKELEDTIDAFIDGEYRLADKEYVGDKPETWEYWYNLKTHEKTTVNKYYEYTSGAGTWIPVKKNFYMGWASSISFSVMKDGKPYRIGFISGIPDSMKEEIVKENNNLIGKVYELSAMQIDFTDGHYTLRHGKILNERPDKKPDDCDFSQITIQST